MLSSSCPLPPAIQYQLASLYTVTNHPILSFPLEDNLQLFPGSKPLLDTDHRHQEEQQHHSA